MNKKWYSIKASAETADVMIYDEIGMWGVSAKSFVEEFNAITAPNINLRINSGGGDVFDGIAIANAIKSHKANTTAIVDGLAASIASIIAIAAKKTNMAKNAYMMIHNPWTMAAGDSGEMRKQADLLDKLAGTMAETYAGKTGKPLDEMKSVMAAETWLDANECKAMGMCDAVLDEEGNIAALAVNAVLRFPSAPEKIKKIAASIGTQECWKIEAEETARIAEIAETQRIRNEIENEQAVYA